MNDDLATSELADEGDGDDAPADGGTLDQYDDAVIAADDTGMLAGERDITMAEIEEALPEEG